MQVSELTPAAIGDWDAYVAQAKDGHPFQLSGWRDAMEASYGYRDWYLLAHENAEIVGVLPLYRVRSMIFGTSITSLPRGLCADSPGAAEALLERAREIMQRAHAGSMVIRDCRRCWGNETAWRHNCTIAVCELPEEVSGLRKAVKRQMLQHVSKADKAGVKAVTMTGHRAAEARPGGPCAEDQVPDELTQRDVDAFYCTFCDLLHEKGVPVFGRKLVNAAVSWLPDHVAVTTACLNGTTIGTILHLTLNDTVYATWGGSPSRYRDYRPSHALWWESMRYAVSHGYRYLDMGRSMCGSGSEEFKSRWGGKLEPIYRYSLSMRGRTMYDPAEDDCADPRYRLFTTVWARLPNFVVRAIGPWLRRHIPFA